MPVRMRFSAGLFHATLLLVSVVPNPGGGLSPEEETNESAEARIGISLDDPQGNEGGIGVSVGVLDTEMRELFDSFLLSSILHSSPASTRNASAIDCKSEKWPNETYTESFHGLAEGDEKYAEQRANGQSSESSETGKPKRNVTVLSGERFTLCWIETVTIKEDRKFTPPKRLVLREFSVSFENSATIPSEYLDCEKTADEERESNIVDAILEDTKRSKLVNLTNVNWLDDVVEWQHRNVKCAVGPVLTQSMVERVAVDGGHLATSRLEFKVSPRVKGYPIKSEKVRWTILAVPILDGSTTIAAEQIASSGSEIAAELSMTTPTQTLAPASTPTPTATTEKTTATTAVVATLENTTTSVPEIESDLEPVPTVVSAEVFGELETTAATATTATDTGTGTGMGVGVGMEMGAGTGTKTMATDREIVIAGPKLPPLTVFGSGEGRRTTEEGRSGGSEFAVGFEWQRDSRVASSRTETVSKASTSSSASGSSAIAAFRRKLNLKVKVTLEHVDENERARDLGEMQRSYSLGEYSSSSSEGNFLQELGLLEESLSSGLLNGTFLTKLLEDTNKFISEQLRKYRGSVVHGPDNQGSGKRRKREVGGFEERGMLSAEDVTTGLRRLVASGLNEIAKESGAGESGRTGTRRRKKRERRRERREGGEAIEEIGGWRMKRSGGGGIDYSMEFQLYRTRK